MSADDYEPCGIGMCAANEGRPGTCAEASGWHEPDVEPATLQMRNGPWRDRYGDVWALGEDGLLHTPETRPFSREHVEKKWGPLIPAEPSTTPAR